MQWIYRGFAVLCGSAVIAHASSIPIDDTHSLRMPSPGAFGFRILSSNIVELTLITTKDPDPAPMAEWDFVLPNGTLLLPDSSEFEVTIEGRRVNAEAISFKRRPLYAPLKQRDLRIGNYLYLQLAEAVADGETVRVLNPSQTLFPAEKTFAGIKNPFRWHPAIHVNQSGYHPALPKKAAVGFYLGNAGEMPIPPQSGFNIIETSGSNIVYSGELTLRVDSGYSYSPLPYQSVLEADFSLFQTEGEYWLGIPDLGISFPFRIHNGTIAAIARTYALGLYHQRCGVANETPFTRHTHGSCHTTPAQVPTISFTAANSFLAQHTADYLNEPRHTARPITNVSASLYPFINTNAMDVSGGHHDAGDYSKYTINSAQFIHALIFAIDTTPAILDLDDLGLPESGDGISDLLQIAKREADFLAKMQDADGGFYFLVYPRDRQYEHDVLPDRGDPQIVYPKTTTATAAAIAALAQIASSPSFGEYYPVEAAAYLQKARDGWDFLMGAIAAHGRDGSYQKITHYGSTFIHDDELAWASTELFLATGESRFHDELRENFDPSDPSTRLWGWWRLYEGYGCAVRSYAFAQRTGRLPESALDPAFLAKCEAEIIAGAEDQLHYSKLNAYGVSFPIPSKEFRVAGWFFPVNQAFDLFVGAQLAPKPEYLDAILANLNFEAGTNPENISFLTGLGRKRQREIVHQYAQNDRRILPPSGLPLGAIQAGFPYLELYGGELGALTFPSDGDLVSAYAPYDRWSDSFNVTTEFVSAQQARALAVAASLWANHSTVNASWKSADGVINGVPAESRMDEPITISLQSEELDLSEALITWEAKDQEPFIGSAFTFTPTNPGPHWIEAEAALPDGRRIFAAADFNVLFADDRPPNPYQSAALNVVSELTALYHLDFDFDDTTGQQTPIQFFGGTRFDAANIGWMGDRFGGALRFDEVGDYGFIEITNSTLVDAGTEAIVFEFMLFLSNYPSSNSNTPLATLTRNWNASLELLQNRYFGITLRGGTEFETSGNRLSQALRRNQWNHLRLAIGNSGYSVRINGELFSFLPSNEFDNWNDPRGVSRLEVGNFEGWIDEIAVWNVKTNHALTLSPSRNGAELHIGISGNAGVHYILESSTDLLDWTALSTNLVEINPVPFLVPIDEERKFVRATPLP